MNKIHKYLDTNLLAKEINRIQEERAEIKRRQAVLRTRESRLRKILKDLNQIPLELET